MRQQLLSLAAAVPPALTGAPWWAVVVSAVLVLVAGELRGLLRDWGARRLDARLMETVSKLADPREEARALIDYRRAATADPATPTEGTPTTDGPYTT
ncbi:hypothetical protein ACFU5N_15680 [Streptomyces albidoflavus]